MMEKTIQGGQMIITRYSERSARMDIFYRRITYAHSALPKGKLIKKTQGKHIPATERLNDLPEQVLDIVVLASDGCTP